MELSKAEKRKLVELCGVVGFKAASTPLSQVLASLQDKSLIEMQGNRIILTDKGRVAGGRLKNQ